jgi:hypothetical protein
MRSLLPHDIIAFAQRYQRVALIGDLGVHVGVRFVQLVSILSHMFTGASASTATDAYAA